MTEPGRKAADGPAVGNSLYSLHLAKQMKRESLEVELALNDVPCLSNPSGFFHLAIVRDRTHSNNWGDAH